MITVLMKTYTIKYSVTIAQSMFFNPKTILWYKKSYLDNDVGTTSTAYKEPILLNKYICVS